MFQFAGQAGDTNLRLRGRSLCITRCVRWSGRRGSNSRPSAWKADALSTELLPQKYRCRSDPEPHPETGCAGLLHSERISVGSDGFEPPKAYASRFTVCPIWPLWYLPILFCSRMSAGARHRADGGIRTPDQLITNQLLWPTELHRHFYRFGLQKYELFFYPQNFCGKIAFCFRCSLKERSIFGSTAMPGTAERWKSGAKIIIINNPQNPIGIFFATYPIFYLHTLRQHA